MVYIWRERIVCVCVLRVQAVVSMSAHLGTRQTPYLDTSTPVHANAPCQRFRRRVEDGDSDWLEDGADSDAEDSPGGGEVRLRLSAACNRHDTVV